MTKIGAKTSNVKRDLTAPKRVDNPPRGTQLSAAEPRGRGVVSNPLTSKEVKKSAPKQKKSVKKAVKKATLGVGQTDTLGYKLAALPIARKDKEIVATLLHEELGISDLDRFMREVHREDVPTPKT